MKTTPEKPLSIIHEVPPHIPLPVSAYGGTERVVQGLIYGLTKAGLDVSVRCSGDSFPDPARGVGGNKAA